MNKRDILKNKQRIVIKVGTSTILHEETGAFDLLKMEKLVRILTNLRNMGKEVVVVSSGAIGVGRKALSLKNRPEERSLKQACAAVGQCRLMMVYQKLFSEYNQITAQVLMTKFTIANDISRENAQNTFRELLQMGVIPIVNENDTVATDELDFGDNDSLSAIVAALVEADLLILLSDIDGLFTDDPKINEKAEFISFVEKIDDKLIQMGKGPSSNLGTGGMASKINAAQIANDAGVDMVIVNGDNLNHINDVLKGKEIGTLFLAHETKDFQIEDYLSN